MPESPTIPASVDAITPEWLTAVLRDAGALPEGRVTGMDVTLIGAGVGFIGSIAKIGLAYEGAPDDAPAKVVVKLPSPDPGSRALGMMYGLYEREVRFYQQLAPQAGIAVPGCYLAAYDANGSAVLVLEALEDGRFGDQVAGSTPDEASLAVRHLARFHAKWWESPRVAEFPWIVPGETLLKAPLEMMYDACWQPFLARYGELITASLRDVMPDLGRRTLKALDEFLVGPRTICQGDYRPDNLFYGTPGTPHELVACDWQTPTYSPGISDLAYVITGSLSVDDRRRHENDLLAEYHTGLREGGISTYSLEQLREDYQGYFVGVIATGVILGATLPEANERGRALMETTFRRFTTAMDDLDALRFLPEL